uniref:Mab-21 domain-containing protein n=1 Tax=Steinernema glaseri TaxID=37863 RepID=A0A1I7YVG9_9BILA
MSKLRASVPPQWLQKTVLKAFFQPQLQELKLSFDHSGWTLSVLCDFLLRDWLWREEVFPESSKVLEIRKAPPITLLKTYGFSSIGKVLDDDSPYFHRRRFLLRHPESTARTLELTVFTSSTEATETLSDEEFLEKAIFLRIRFHFNRGQNAMYWRTLRTTPITEKPRVKKPPVPEPQGTQLQEERTEVSQYSSVLAYSVVLSILVFLLICGYFIKTSIVDSIQPGLKLDLHAIDCYDTKAVCREGDVLTDVEPWIMSARCCKEESKWTPKECRREYGDLIFGVIPCSEGYVWNQKWHNAWKIWCCPLKD